MRQMVYLMHDERGGVGFNLLWVCFIIIFLIPFFWDVGSVHYARRFAGTGADGASLAAAQEYARRLQYVPAWNGIWYGQCPHECTPQQVVLRYRGLPAFGAPPGIGYGQAQQYAALNRDELTAYGSWRNLRGARFMACPFRGLSSMSKRSVQCIPHTVRSTDATSRRRTAPKRWHTSGAGMAGTTMQQMVHHLRFYVRVEDHA